MNNQEDNTDALKFLRLSKSKTKPKAVLPVSKDSDRYNMKHPNRGKCLIFDNKKFDPRLQLDVCEGTEVDGNSIQHCFSKLNFKVHLCKDYEQRRLLDKLKDVAKEDHSNSDCFVCCILTHGDEYKLYALDRPYMPEEVFEPFYGDVCTTLAGKPKLFFIQACQCHKLDADVKMKYKESTCQCHKLDADVKMKYKESTDFKGTCKLPTHADFLIAYENSLVPEYCAWLNPTNGSWFIQELCQVLENYAEEMDLLEMLTVVIHRVAYNCESCAPRDPIKNKMQEVPCITFTLTRKIYFE